MRYQLRDRTNILLREPISTPPSYVFSVQLKEAMELEIQKFSEGDPADGVSEPDDGIGKPSAFPEEIKTHSQPQFEENGSKRKLTAAFGENPVDNPDNFASSRSHRRRRAQRNARIANEGHKPRPKILTEILAECKPLRNDINLTSLPSTSCGYQAKHEGSSSNSDAKTPHTVEDLLKDGYTYVPWAAIEVQPFVTDAGKIFGGMVGQPKDPEYQKACDRLYEKFRNLGEDPDLQDEAANNRRGPFPVLNVGVTHGKGTREPVNLHGPTHGKPQKHSDKVDALLNDEDLNRVATFGSSAFQLWAPQLFDYYKTKLDALYARKPHLRKNFKKSIFPCAAINCGPNAWTYYHRDSMNCPFGMCAITALGRFDHTKGGHLVLPELKLVIEFPAGATILIPSATIVHGNIPVQKGDVRASFTQFCPGGLFRFVDNHFMTEKELKKKNKKEYARLMSEKPKRWQAGLDLLSNFDDLVESLSDE